ncbi:MAG: hypothetical protein HOP10_07620 [Chitinophagaceae bacterium]|nr:hypothetical protein [Chitinophagaceae bacterium]
MKKHLFIPVLLLFIVLIGACKKDSDSSPPATDTSLSAIVIDFPTAGTLYINGSSITITGTIVDNDNLNQARVEIRNKITNAIYNQQQSSTGTVSFYRFTWNWTVAGITGPTQGTVKIISKDKNGFEVSKQVDILLDN